MKETIGKVKKLVNDNKDTILVIGLCGASCVAGMAWGYHVLARAEMNLALSHGVVDGVNIVKVNGLEAAEKFVADLYKVKL